jgi:hypothetical protein
VAGLDARIDRLRRHERFVSTFLLLRVWLALAGLLEPLEGVGVEHPQLPVADSMQPESRRRHPRSTQSLIASAYDSW